MKKIMLFIIAITAVISNIIITVHAEDDIAVYVNGNLLETDQPAIIYQDRTMVPLRAICEALNCKVNWNDSSNTALIENEVTMVAVQINNYNLSKKDRRIGKETTREIPIDVPPIIINQRTLVPARAIAEAINAEVRWDGARNRVDIILEYDAIGDFCNGYAGASKNGKFGYINEDREVVIPLIYDNNAWHHDFDSNGQVVVRKNGLEGVVDSHHDIIVPIKYKGITDYNEYLGLYTANSQDGTAGCFDSDGDVVVPFKYDIVRTEGLKKDDLILVAVQPPRMDVPIYGFVDKYGNEIVTPYKENSDGTCQYGFQYAWDFSEGRAAVCYGYGRWGYIDKTGDYVIEEKFQDAGSFYDGLAYVQYNGYYGYIDKDGNEEIEFKYDDAMSFNEGLAGVELDGKWGFINKRGKTVIPFEYDDVDSFEDGVAIVEKNGYYGVIDQENVFVVPCRYDDIFINSKLSIIFATKDDITYEMDLDGNLMK